MNKQLSDRQAKELGWLNLVKQANHTHFYAQVQSVGGIDELLDEGWIEDISEEDAFQAVYCVSHLGNSALRSYYLNQVVESETERSLKERVAELETILREAKQVLAPIFDIDSPIGWSHYRAIAAFAKKLDTALLKDEQS